MDIESDIKTISDEIRMVSKIKFTGRVTITLGMNSGGIGSINWNTERNLKTGKNGKG